MSDDAFDAFDDVDLDDRFLAQVDTLEQTALTQQQHSQSQSQSQLQPAAKKARSNAYQSNNNNNNNNTPATHVHLDDSDRPAAVAQRCAQAGDADSADLAGQWEAALAALEAENARLREKQGDFDTLQRKMLAKEGEAATLRRQQALATSKSTKALAEEQERVRLLNDQIKSIKAQFVADLERANTQRAFQRHEHEAAQRRARLQLQSHSQLQTGPVKKSPSKKGLRGFTDGFGTPVSKGKQQQSSSPQQPPQSSSPLPQEEEEEGPAVVAEEEDDAQEIYEPDNASIRAHLVALLFAHRYISPHQHPKQPSQPTFHLLVHHRPPSDCASEHADAVSALYSALSASSSSSHHLTHDALQLVFSNLVKAFQRLIACFSRMVVLGCKPKTGPKEENEDNESTAAAAIPPLASALDWLSRALVHFPTHMSTAVCAHQPGLISALESVASACAASAKPKTPTLSAREKQHAAFYGLAEKKPKLELLARQEVKGEVLGPLVRFLQGLVWLPSDPTVIESWYIDATLVSSLLQASLPPTVILSTMQWLLMSASHPHLYRSLLATPFSPKPAAGGENTSRIPLVETLAGYLHYASPEASPIFTAQMHILALRFFLRLYAKSAGEHAQGRGRGEDADLSTLLSGSQALIPKLISRIAADAGVLYESDGVGFGRCPASLIVSRLCSAVKLLYLLSATPKQMKKFNLRSHIHHSLAHYSGILQMFNVAIGRLATADPPEWLDQDDRKRVDDLADPAQMLLDLVFSPEEQDDIYAMNQGAEPEEDEMGQEATDDHEEQQIAAEHLAELEDDDENMN